MASPQLAGSVQPQREGQVIRQVNELSSSIEALAEATNMLINRAASISRSQPPATQGENSKAVECLCPLADQLRNLRDRVDHSIAALVDQRERLEI